ncbi:MAG: DegT/DnrJ/EryC1/StrS family aminotransferase [Chloroflexota bacterium]
MIGRDEHIAVQRVLASGRLSQGQMVHELERAFAELTGARFAIATSNGTASLHAALVAHGVKDGDEVITTPFTFFATVGAIMAVGARPRFVDVDETFNLDPSLVEDAIGPHTRAVLPVHLFGLPVDMERLTEIADRHGLVVIQDAAQAHGATLGGRALGSFGTACYSFYATKNMTTGEGGCITTNDPAVERAARLFINHGMNQPYAHERMGLNFRMCEMAASIGVVQLRKLQRFNAARAANAAYYQGALVGVKGLTLPRSADGREHVWHQFTIRVSRERDAMRKRLAAEGIQTGVYYATPLHRQRAVTEVFGLAPALPVAERLAREVLSIPVHPDLKRSQLVRVVKAVTRCAVEA